MPAGEGFSPSQRLQIDKAIRGAEMVCRFEFSVYVGAVPEALDPREYAGRLHGALVAPSRSVLILVDPSARLVEVVTGEEVRRKLDDQSVRLALAEMQTLFVHGDLAGGIVRGINSMASSARQPRTLHA